MENIKKLSEGLKTFQQNVQKVLLKQRIKNIVDLSELQRFKLMVTKKMK